MSGFSRLLMLLVIVFFPPFLFAANNNIDCPPVTTIAEIKFSSAQKSGTSWVLSQRFDYKNRPWVLQYYIQLPNVKEQNVLNKAQEVFKTIPLAILGSTADNKVGVCIYAQSKFTNSRLYTIYAAYGPKLPNSFKFLQN